MLYSPEDLKTIRNAAKLTQKKFAENIDLARETIVRMEAGTMPISKTVELYLTSLKGNNKSQQKNMIPLYDSEASAGGNAVMDMIPVSNPTGMIDVGDFLRDSECAIRIYGNSMTPNYPSGCIIGLRLVKDGIVQYGNVYVIETEDNRYFKRLYKDDDGSGYSCYSDNDMVFETGPRKGKHFYEPFTIPLTHVRRIFRVIGMIKRNEHSGIIGN